MSHVLFWDIDGTLLSTARAGIFALEQAARDVTGAEPDLSGMHTAGMTDFLIALEVLETMGRERSEDEAAALLRAYEAHLPERLTWRQGQVLPGVREVLDDVARRPGVHSLLLTGNTRAGARAKLDHYDLAGYFEDGAFCADGDDRPAIARRAWAMAGERLDGRLDGERAYVIGDTAHDVHAAHAIGARAVAVLTGPAPRVDVEAAGPWRVWDALPAPQEFAAQLGLPDRA